MLAGPGTLPGCARSCGSLNASPFCACFPRDITKLVLSFSDCPWKKKKTHFFAWVTEGRKVKEKWKKLLGDFEELHLTVLPYHSLLASLECVRKRQTWTTTLQSPEQWSTVNQVQICSHSAFLSSSGKQCVWARSFVKVSQVPDCMISASVFKMFRFASWSNPSWQSQLRRQWRSLFGTLLSDTVPCRFLWVSQPLSEAGLREMSQGPVAHPVFIGCLSLWAA